MCHRNRRVATAVRSIFCMAVTVALTFLLPVVLREQQAHAQPQTQSSRETARADLEARQRALRNLEKVKQRLSRRPLEQHLISYQNIKEDFEQLQLVNYHLSGTVFSGPVLDYEQIRKDATEVKKRASRLKTNLLLPEPEKDEKPQKSKEGFSGEELKPAIDALDALVKSFVWNPIFQQPNVLDVEHSVQARRDLEGIIRLSEQIQKRAEALSKAAGKDHH